MVSPRMADPSPTIGVAVVSWNVRELLRRCLASLEGQWPDLRVVVVDNASSDGTVEMVADDFPAVRVIPNEANLGFTVANNQALRLLGAGSGAPDAPWATFLLNPDTEVRPGAIGALARHLSSAPRVAVVGPLLRYSDGAVQSSRRRFPSLAVAVLESTPFAWRWPHNPVARRYRMDDLPPDRPSDVDWVTGAAMLVRSSALAEVGLFDEGFFLYSEELDLCRRLAGAGWLVRYEPAAEVMHHEARSSDQVVAARHLWFHRSRVRYFRKHHGTAAAALVRGSTLVQFAGAWLAEAARLAVGHKPVLRRRRMAAYAALLRDGLGWSAP